MPSTHQVEMMMASTASPPRIVVAGNQRLTSKTDGRNLTVRRQPCWLASAAESEMGDENHQPHKQRRRTARCRTYRRRLSWESNRQQGCDRQSDGGEHERRDRSASPGDASQRCRRVACARTSEKIMRVARYRLQFMPESAAVSTTKLMMLRGRGNVHHVEDAHEWADRDALSRLNLRPGNHANENGDGADVKDYQPRQHGSHGARDGALGILGFAGGDRDNLGANEAEDDKRQRKPDAEPSVGQEAAVGAKVFQPNGSLLVNAEKNRRAQHDEHGDGAHFDHREPVFKGAEGADAARVDENQHRRVKDDPSPSRRVRKPPLGVDRRGYGFSADGHRLRGPVGVAHDEARPGRNIEIGIDAERACRRVCDRHLGQAVHQQQRDDRK